MKNPPMHKRETKTNILDEWLTLPTHQNVSQQQSTRKRLPWQQMSSMTIDDANEQLLFFHGSHGKILGQSISQKKQKIKHRAYVAKKPLNHGNSFLHIRNDQHGTIVTCKPPGEENNNFSTAQIITRVRPKQTSINTTATLHVSEQIVQTSSKSIHLYITRTT